MHTVRSIYTYISTHICWFWFRVELIFVPVASMGLCLRFLLNTMLMIYRWGFFVVVPKVFSAFPTGTLVRRLGVHGRLGGDVAGTGDPN